MNVFSEPLPLVCGLAFDIEKAHTRSGFRPAKVDLGAEKNLFADLRLEGFAALLRLGFTETLMIFGGNEKRYHGETVNVSGKKVPLNRGWAIAQMLIQDYGIPEWKVGSSFSLGNTVGNIEAIRQTVGKRQSVVVSNHYHLPRAALDLYAVGLQFPLYAAEAFWLLEDESRKNTLIQRLGGNAYAERVAEEIQGIAHKLAGAYTPRADKAPTKKRWWHILPST